jgi:hypothetical protein
MPSETTRLNDTLRGKVEEIFSAMSVPQRRNMLMLMIGIYLSRSVQLHKIAAYIMGEAKDISVIRRISRFLKNFGVSAKKVYETEAIKILQRLSVNGQIRVLIDGSKIGFGHQLVMVAVAYRKRALPIAWAWVKYTRGHSNADMQVALLREVKALIEQVNRAVKVSLVGDSEFENGEVLKW